MILITDSSIFEKILLTACMRQFHWTHFSLLWEWNSLSFTKNRTNSTSHVRCTHDQRKNMVLIGILILLARTKLFDFMNALQGHAKLVYCNPELYSLRTFFIFVSIIVQKCFFPPSMKQNINAFSFSQKENHLKKTWTTKLHINDLHEITSTHYVKQHWPVTNGWNSRRCENYRLVRKNWIHRKDEGKN